ncbi:MAG: carboxypeptidase-like regulatory domain-containing protein [Bryobacteraceae bacterium]
MRIHKPILFVLAIAATVGLVHAQPPGAGAPNNQGKLFGGKPPSEEDPHGRNLQGAVTNEAGDLVDGAVVSLKNLKSGSERSFITKKDGIYRFEKLLMDADYEMMAKYKGAASDIKKLSMYDSRKRAVRNFVIPKKAEEPAKIPAPAKANSPASKNQP